VSTMPITELVDRCAAMAATHRRLFDVLGGWAVDDPDPIRQRWYATAAHRHAWHAELWDERRPAIPVEPTPAAAATGLTPPEGTDERADWYSGVLARLLADTAALAGDVDAVLDPGTVRVTQLVGADLGELVSTAPG
jgi:hypothetical protein